jgi:hypothetical protein
LKICWLYNKSLQFTKVSSGFLSWKIWRGYTSPVAGLVGHMNYPWSHNGKALNHFAALSLNAEQSEYILISYSYLLKRSQQQNPWAYHMEGMAIYTTDDSLAPPHSKLISQVVHSLITVTQ